MKREVFVVLFLVIAMALNFSMCMRVMFTEPDGESIWAMFSFFTLVIDLAIMASLGLMVVTKISERE